MEVLSFYNSFQVKVLHVATCMTLCITDYVYYSIYIIIVHIRWSIVAHKIKCI